MRQNKSSNNLFKDSSSLVTFFKECYKEKYKRNLVVNRFKTKYYFLDVLEDHSASDIERLIKHYFKVGANGSHSISDFLSCYDELEKSMSEYSDDVVERRRLRELTKKRVEDYRRRDL